jgi:hypothetical protein
MLIFFVFSGDDPQHSRCETYFDMYRVEPSLWIRVASMHLEGLPRGGFNLLKGGCMMLVGLIFTSGFMIGSGEISMTLSSGSCSIFGKLHRSLNMLNSYQCL